MGWVSDPFFFYLCFIMTKEEIIEKYRGKVEKLLIKPTHISYIKNYIFKFDELKVKEIITTFVNEGILEEHSMFKDYYGTKKD